MDILMAGRADSVFIFLKKKKNLWGQIIFFKNDTKS